MSQAHLDPAQKTEPLLTKEQFLLAARAFCNLYREIKLYHKDPTFWHLNEEKCYMHRGRDEGSGWHRLSFCKGIIAHSSHTAGLKQTGGLEAFKSFVKAYGVDPDAIFPVPGQGDSGYPSDIVGPSSQSLYSKIERYSEKIKDRAHHEIGPAKTTFELVADELEAILKETT